MARQHLRALGLGAGALVLAMVGGRLDASQILTTGVPQNNNGAITVTANGKKVTVNVAKGTAAADKAAAIGQALNKAGAGVVVTGDQVKAPGMNGTIAVNKDTTGENSKVSAELVPLDRGHLAYFGTLTGLNDSGGVSSFQASLGFGATTATSSFLFTDLSSPDINGVLQLTYNQLSASLPVANRPALSLDLAGGQITFDYPVSASQGFFSVFTTDTGAATGLSIQAVPEPSTLVMVTGGVLAGVGFWGRRRRAGSPSPLD